MIRQPLSSYLNGNPAQNTTIKQPPAWESWAVPHLVCQVQCVLHARALVFAFQPLPAARPLVGPREANAPGGDGRRGGSSRQTPRGKCCIDAPWRAQLPQAACCVDRNYWNKRCLQLYLATTQCYSVRDTWASASRATGTCSCQASIIKHLDVFGSQSRVPKLSRDY